VIYDFEDCSLDTDRRELRRGSNLVAIEPQVFDLLLFLIRNRARVVSKDDLFTEVWNGRIVSESALYSRITNARHAIGDTGEAQRLIRTVARKGLRFVGEVRERPQPGDVGAELPAAPHETMPQAAVQGSAERRQLTIMVCNMVDAGALAAQLDPEDFREVVATYHGCVREVAESHGGFVAKYLADGVAVYFGYPHAHEDDAERAVRAGLAAIAAVPDLNVKGVADGVRARVAIATGVVVVGDAVGTGATADHTVLGQAPLLAAQLLALAAPDAVLVSALTRRLLGNMFDCRELDLPQSGSGVEAGRVYQVLGESMVAGRFDALRPGRSELVGREEELDLLLRRWELAERGVGRAVLLIGEAGIGKSRLARALQERLYGVSYVSLILDCSPLHKDTAFHPISAELLRAAGIEPGDGAETKLDKLEALLQPSSESLAKDVPLFAALLSIPVGESSSPARLTPQQLKEHTLAALLRRLKRLCDARPVLMIVEDLQWIDPTSLEALCRIIEEAAGLRLLLLMTARLEFTPPWPNHRHTATMALTRLGRSETEALVVGMSHGRPLPPEVFEQIADRTDGVPLFIEELTKSVLESGLLREVGDRYELSGPLPALAIPSTLHASLLARLDRLAMGKDIAQVSAAIGREFSYNLILAVGGLAEPDLNAALARLVAAGLIFQRGSPPEATYAFKHALLQDAAYGSVLRGRRRQIHANIRRALEDRFPEITEAQPELLAFHCSEAGLVREAIDYWERAGRQAAERFASTEATGHFQRALKLLQQRPEGIERDGRELDLVIALGPALLATRPSADPEVAKNYARAGELARKTGRSGELFPSLWGAHLVAVVAGDNTTAAKLVDELLALARSLNDPGFLLQAHHAAFGVRRTSGDLADAQKHAEAAVDIYRPDRHGRHALVYGAHDPGACACMNLALLLLLGGFPDQSQARADQGLALARSLRHPQSLLQTLRMAADLHSLRREPGATADLAAELLRLSAQHGSAVGTANAALLSGWARIMRGERADGLGEVQEGLRLWRQTGSKLHVPQRLACVAEYFIAAGRPQLAWPLLEEAFVAAKRFGERFFESELHRLKGELLLELFEQRQDDAIACCQRALTIARSQDARLLELRAATSLAHLWHRQDRHSEATTLLAPLLAWFTEGLTLPDLHAAKVLLDPLTSRPRSTRV
jgi:DNA-binding winged helix-turn-helix (wHTH) protein/predicted ATPase